MHLYTQETILCRGFNAPTERGTEDGGNIWARPDLPVVDILNLTRK